jgi:hypothetical protein
MEPSLEPELSPDLQPKSKLMRYLLWIVFAIVTIFVASLFISPILHPDRAVTKVGIITNIATSGDPYFNETVYTLTFQDGDVIEVKAQNSVPFPVGKPIAITYSERDKTLLGVNLVPNSMVSPPAIPVHK